MPLLALDAYLMMQVLIIKGSNFGMDSTVISRVSYGPTGIEFIALSCTLLVPHEQLSCITPPGIGIGLGFSIVVDKLVSEAPTTKFNTPSNVTVADVLPGYSTRVSICSVLVVTLGCACYRRVPKFSPYGSVCCACAQRPVLPRACHSG
jgi:hypothetical protein